MNEQSEVADYAKPNNSESFHAAYDVPAVAVKAQRWMLKRISNSIGGAPVEFALRDRARFAPPDVSPVATIRIGTLRTLARMIFDPEVGFGDAYTDGRIEVDGDLVQALEGVYRTIPRPGWLPDLKSKWMDWRQQNSRSGSRHNIHRHYDIGNEFYRLWLDTQMLYTCAFFPSQSATLEEAQVAKMDRICRKLRLQPGETVVEAGCGWGALGMHMARYYGVTVKAFNISREQIEFARRRAAETGVGGKVEFVEDDYRNIGGSFDAFVSVGMLEHVGPDGYRVLGDVIHRAVGDAGRGLVHFIGRNYSQHFSRWIRKRIFPGAHAPTLREAMSLFEDRDYAVLDVENLRLHYARTLEHWLERFERSGEQIASMFDASFQRAWRLYLAGSIAGFSTGSLQLFQIVFAGSKRGQNSWTRPCLCNPEQPLGEKVTWNPAMS
jgi:cyclopropane-fatty-acyl-phospholipid synthase